MSRIIQIGNIFTRASFENPTCGRVYSVDGLCPTLNTNGGGYHLPMIIVEETRNGENEREIENEIKVIGKLSSSQDAVVVDASGISPTHTSGHGNCPKIIEPRIDNLGSYKPNGYNASCVVSGSGIAPTVRENHGEVTAVLEPKYRIRRLTERECFRLMDVDDADIDKIYKGYFGRASLMPLSYGKGEDRNNPAVKFKKCDRISKSQMYKMAGNSICVGVLYHIFRKMFVDKDNEQQQLTLF